jgi:hypothetical protein
MRHLLLPLRTAALCASVGLLTAAQAATVFTDDFSGIGAGPLPASMPGSGFELVDGYAQGRDDAAPQGRYLWLAAGWYAESYDQQTNIGDSKVASTLSFDLLAGHSYTLAFDWSRGPAGGGNGPFAMSLTAEVGSQSVSYNDVTGFYYGTEWRPGLLTWTQASDEPGVQLRFIGSGFAYAAAAVDNIVFSVQSPVPEPATWALWLASLVGGCALRSRRRR